MELTLDKKHIGVLCIILMIYPVIWLDSIYGIFSYMGLGALRVSMLYRTLILLVGLYIAYTTSGPIGWLIKVMILAWSLLLLTSTFPDGNVAITKDINHLLRRLYPFTVMLTTLWLLNKFGDHTKTLVKGIGHYGVVFALVMLFSLVTGIGDGSYGDYAFGIKSFFVGGNDIGLAAIISLSVVFAQLYYNVSLINLIRVGIVFIGLVLLGTKAGWAGTIAIAGCFTLIFLFFFHGRSLYQKTFKWTLILLVITSFIAASLFVKDNFESFEFQLKQAEEILDGASPRKRLLEAYNRAEASYPETLLFLGDGAAFYEAVGREYYLVDNNKGTFDVFKEIEQEWPDLVGGYGVPYTVFVFAFHGLFIGLTLLLFIRTPSVEHFALSVAVSIYLGHGIFAGHAFVSGQPSHLIGVIYAIATYRLAQQHHLSRSFKVS